MEVLRLCLAGRDFDTVFGQLPMDCFQFIGEGFAPIKNKTRMLSVCQHPERILVVFSAFFC